MHTLPFGPITTSITFTCHVGLDKLEYLQNHPSEQIYRLAYRIIEKFFSDEDEVDSSVEPKESEDGGQFVFNSNSHPPDGGFHF